MSKFPHLSSNSSLLGLSSEELEEFALQEGEKAFRGRQIYEWIYQKGVQNLDSITVLPKGMEGIFKKQGHNHWKT